MKCFLGMADFLEEISSLSHSIVFLFFFTLITEEGFLIYPCYSSKFCIQIPHVKGKKKKYPTYKGKGKPQQDGRRGEFACRIKPHISQRCSEGSNKPCAHRDTGTPQRLRQNCVGGSPVEVRVSSGMPQREGLWVQPTWVWYQPSWRGSPLTSP